MQKASAEHVGVAHALGTVVLCAGVLGKLGLERTLGSVKHEAESLLANWTNLEGQEGRAFLTERLNALAQRRSDLESGLVEADQALVRLKNDSVDTSAVRDALSRFGVVYQYLKPYERKELFHLVLRRAEVHSRKIVLEINGNVPVITAETSEKSGSRSRTPNWLPDEDSNLEPSG